MSKISELITQLCPNGVDYIPISELGTLTRGKRFVHADAVDKGIPCIHYGELYTYYGVSTYTTKSFVREELKDKLRYAHKNDVIIVGAGENDVDIGIAVAYLGDEDVAIHDACYILTQKNNPKYISYCLRTEYYHSQIKKYVSRGKICAISAASIGKAELPIPPLEIQDEIVHILDEYSEKTEKLCKELGAELTARKKQYEYYRDLLLDFGVHGGGTSECEWRTLGTVIISLKTGLNPRQNFSLNENDSNLPYITGKDIYDNAINITERTDRITTDALTLINKRANLESGLLLFASTGTGTVGRMAIIQEYNNDWGISETLYAIKVNESIILTSFLLHYLYSASAKSQFEPKISKGSVPHLKVKDLENVKVPIISIEEQTRIVSILDRFDKLCNDISEGLPAEIEARRKQYEYYRDKLLSFKEQ